MSWGSSATSGKLSWDTNEAIVFGLSGRALNLGSNGVVDRLFIATDGNIGIGTTSPDTLLHVAGNAKFHSGGASGQITVGRGSSQKIDVYVDDLNNRITAYQDSDSNGAHKFISTVSLMVLEQMIL